MILALPRFGDGAVSVHQISVVIGANFVRSFCDGFCDPFKLVLKRLEQGGEKLLNQGSDYLLYALLDAVIDEGSPALEAFGSEVERIEEDVVSHPGRDVLLQLHG